MSEHNDIYRIIESLDAAQRSVKQLPALFKPANTSPQIGGEYPGRNATRGYMVGEGDESVNPMVQAVHRRIAFTRPEWITKYGMDAINYAIEEIVGDDWAGEEIGSSDVSGYIHMIGEYLRDRGGSREEMADRKPFAEVAVPPTQTNTSTSTSTAQPANPMAPADKNKYNQLAQQVNQARKSNQTDRVKELTGQLSGMTGDAGFEMDTQGNIKPVSEQDEEELNLAGEPDHGLFGDDERDEDEGHISPSGVETTMSPKDDDYKINYGKNGLVAKFRRSQGLDVKTGSERVSEAQATEDVLSTMKKKLGDYLQDVATAIQKDPDLKDKIPQAVDQIRAVKTITTDDGHEIKIHGNEDDGFRISIKNREMPRPFKTLDEATMACEMYCSKRRNDMLNADYMEER